MKTTAAAAAPVTPAVAVSAATAAMTMEHALAASPVARPP
jgi:hypothetical protein